MTVGDACVCVTCCWCRIGRFHSECYFVDTFLCFTLTYWLICCFRRHDGILHMDAEDEDSKLLWKLLARSWGGERSWSIYHLGVCNYVTLKTDAAFSSKQLVSTHRHLRREKHRELYELFIIISLRILCRNIACKVLHNYAPISVSRYLLTWLLTSECSRVLAFCKTFFDVIAECEKWKRTWS